MSAQLNELLAVEIETDSACNRRCSYCPRSRFQRPHHRLESDLVCSLFEQLAHLGFAGRLSFHFYNEPLLDSRLPTFVSVAHSTLPDARIVIYTNGDLLDRSRVVDLVSRGCTLFVVTAQEDHQHDRRWLDNLAGLDAGHWQRIRYQDHTNPDIIYTNRGGLVPQGAATATPLRAICLAPSFMMVIASSGKVVLCYEDYLETTVMGDVRRETLAAIWHAKKFARHRQALIAGDRTLTRICRRCNNTELMNVEGVY